MDSTQQALQAAQGAAAAHRVAADAAKRSAGQVAAQAAVLAQQQIVAAAALRGLEEQTGAAAAALAGLDGQSQVARLNLQQNAAALAALLPIMERLSSQPAATMMAVPGSPTDAIRGIIVLQGIAAEIERRAEAVHAQALLVAELKAQTLAQQAVLAKAAAAQQQAEDALSAQIGMARAAETSDLDLAAREAAAAISASRNVHDLRAMIDKLQARQLAALAAEHAKAAPVQPANLKIPLGTAGAPVAGAIVQAYGDPTAAGPAVGMLYQSAPGARVVAPCGGPVLYANSFQSYGLLVIIDCGRNYDFVLSGMHRLDVSAGQEVGRGQPVGEMAAYDARNPAKQPLLYVELRQSGSPVNPAAWLNSGGSG